MAWDESGGYRRAAHKGSWIEASKGHADDTVPGFENVRFHMMPSVAINRLNCDIALAADEVAVKENIFAAGAKAATGTPDQFAATIRSEMSRMGKLIKDQNIRAE